MNRSSRRPDEATRAFWSWLGFWLQFLVLGFLAIVGAFVASGAEQPGEYTCGIVLSLAAIALGFLCLKRYFDGEDADWGNSVLVDTMWNLALVIPLFVVIALGGLFIAHASESGDLHAAGIALFVVSGVIVFLDIKRVYDRIDAEPH